MPKGKGIPELRNGIMKDKKSKPIYVGSEEGEPIPTWWLGCTVMVTFVLCGMSIVWFILIRMP
jgi:hypothetical protein